MKKGRLAAYDCEMLLFVILKVRRYIQSFLILFMLFFGGQWNWSGKFISVIEEQVVTCTDSLS